MPDYSISTPENVELHLELAGVGNRVLACLIDTLISYAAIAAIIAVVWIIFVVTEFSGIPSQNRSVFIGIAILSGIFLCFTVTFGYYIFFEGIWHGQTPGKKVAQIRVIEQNGQPISWPAVLLRNIVRVFDFIAFVGLLVMIIDKNERRCGDLAAGTLVIRERLPELAHGSIELAPNLPTDAPFDIGKITPEEYELIATFLKRRKTLAKQYRPKVAKELADYFKDKLSFDNDSKDSELFLEQVYVTYQARA